MSDEKSIDAVIPCRYCCAPIAKSALLCSTCKSYQNPFRNSLAFLGSITGLIGLIGALFAYTFANWSSITYTFKSGFDPEVAFLFAQQDGARGIIIVNKGSKSIFFRYFTIQWRGDTASYDVNKQVEVGSSLEFKSSKEETMNLQMIFSEDGTLKEDLFNLINSQSNSEHPCFRVHFSLPDDGKLSTADAFAHRQGKKLIQDTGLATAVFTTSEQPSTRYYTFPVSAWFTESTDPKCATAQ